MDIYLFQLLLLFSHSVMSNSLWPIDCRPPGSPVDRILQARIQEQTAISLSPLFQYYLLKSLLFSLNCLSSLLECFFPFYFFYYIYCNDQFVFFFLVILYVEPTLHFWDKCHWVITYNIFHMLLDLI